MGELASEPINSKELLSSTLDTNQYALQKHLYMVAGFALGNAIQGTLVLTGTDSLIRATVPTTMAVLNYLISEPGQNFLFRLGSWFEKSKTPLIAKIGIRVQDFAFNFSVEQIATELDLLYDEAAGIQDPENRRAIIQEAMALQSRYDSLVLLRDILIGVLGGSIAVESAFLTFKKIRPPSTPIYDPSMPIQV